MKTPASNSGTSAGGRPAAGAQGVRAAGSGAHRVHERHDRLGALEHARAAKARADADRRAQIIWEELARHRTEACSCPITPARTYPELQALGAACTAGRWVCPTLDAIRRRPGT
jgi:hypothetical protein